MEPTKLTDEQVEQELKSLIDKQEKTAEESQKLTELKEERQTRYQKRIDKLNWEKRTAAEESDRLRKENEELKKRAEEFEKKRSTPVDIAHDTLEINGQKFYTDKALINMVKAGELTDDEAWSYQRKRDKEEIKADLMREQTEKQKANQWQDERNKDLAWMEENHPEFNPKHPDYNPNSELFKLADELFRDGLGSNPKGLSLSVKRAKQILRLDDRKPDISDELSVGRNRSAVNDSGKVKDLSLSEDEKDHAVRLYVQGGVVNPKTGKPYTESEAIQKATQAKNNRVRR